MKLLIGKDVLEEIANVTAYDDEPYQQALYDLVTTNIDQPIEVTKELYFEILDIEEKFGDPLSKVSPKMWKQLKQFAVDMGVVRLHDPEHFAWTSSGRKTTKWFSLNKINYSFDAHPKFGDV